MIYVKLYDGQSLEDSGKVPPEMASSEEGKDNSSRDERKVSTVQRDERKIEDAISSKSGIY